ncbi:MAG: nucleotidyl transferase AbiEii/AbiGii toxin family protein [Anaerolineae bacterium]|nr:nucleotidyl transferase AbiEii/AbiGii toxin family protein [Anaerolineae bacterium]
MGSVEAMQPSRPTHLSLYAEACLRSLVANELGDRISLGGAFGLLHYLDYRPTHDVDAWWVVSATAQERQFVIDTITTTLESFGQVRTRAWGDVVSVELSQEGRVAFSFQIASRSAQLEPPSFAPWADVLLDSFADLMASKMVALVERGAPRDFRDIYALCQARLTTPSECWKLWRQRQQLAGSDTGSTRARLAVQTHLARIAVHRPLEQITDPQQRAEADHVRSWFTGAFLDVFRSDS